MNTKIKPSDAIALSGVISPQSNAAAATKTSTYIDMSLLASALAIINVGAVTATGLVDAKLVQAKDSSGTDKKDITGKAVTQMATSNKQSMINIFAEEMDGTGGFTFVALEITNTTAAALVSASLIGVNPRYLPASSNDVSSVVEIV